MRIIRKGKDREWRVECRDCSTIFAYSLSDIIKKSGIDGYNKRSEYNCVQCPVCKKYIVVN